MPFDWEQNPLHMARAPSQPHHQTPHPCTVCACSVFRRGVWCGDQTGVLYCRHELKVFTRVWIIDIRKSLGFPEAYWWVKREVLAPALLEGGGRALIDFHTEPSEHHVELRRKAHGNPKTTSLQKTAGSVLCKAAGGLGYEDQRTNDGLPVEGLQSNLTHSICLCVVSPIKGFSCTTPPPPHHLFLT